jgi:hypothetical protein
MRMNDEGKGGLNSEGFQPRCGFDGNKIIVLLKPGETLLQIEKMFFRPYCPFESAVKYVRCRASRVACCHCFLQYRYRLPPSPMWR